MNWVCGTDENSVRLTVFNSEECIETVRNIHLFALFHTCGYFWVDFYFAAVVRRGMTSFDIQMHVHHLVSIATFYITLCFYNFAIIMGVLFLFMEISTIFISFRWFFYEHGMDKSLIAIVNAVVGSMAFLFGRLTFQIFITVRFGFPKLL
jgi:hypothetical protein